MVRHVFFSFHYERDNWRASVVRESGLTQDQQVAGYIDSTEWEKLERQGDAAIKRWINKQLKGTTVTAVLIGAQTHGRKWIDYEIEQSAEKGNGIVGVYVNMIKDQNGNTDLKGKNPLAKWHWDPSGQEFIDVYNTYDWKTDDGFNNFGAWVEEAARRAGK